MIWLLTLHIAALLFWSAALLYLPALIAGTRLRRIDGLEEPADTDDSLARVVFTHFATPAALLTIVAGTLIFLFDRNTAPWLIVKLTLVAMLVFCHALIGVLVMRLEDSPDRSQQPWCTLVALLAVGLMIGILWLVLAKPPLEVLPWRD